MELVIRVRSILIGQSCVTLITLHDLEFPGFAKSDIHNFIVGNSTYRDAANPKTTRAANS